MQQTGEVYANVAARARRGGRGWDFVQPDAQSIIVVGDKAAVTGQLKPYGEFSISTK